MIRGSSQDGARRVDRTGADCHPQCAGDRGPRPALIHIFLVCGRLSNGADFLCEVNRVDSDGESPPRRDEDANSVD